MGTPLPPPMGAEEEAEAWAESNHRPADFQYACEKP